MLVMRQDSLIVLQPQSLQVSSSLTLSSQLSSSEHTHPNNGPSWSIRGFCHTLLQPGIEDSHWIGRPTRPICVRLDQVLAAFPPMLVPSCPIYRYVSQLLHTLTL